MRLTIIKETGGSQHSDAEHIVNAQKLIVSTALDRFTPFQFLLVPVSSKSSAHVLCQVVKKPDLHQNFCYLNTSVVCYKREDERESSKNNEESTNVGGDCESSKARKQLTDNDDIGKGPFLKKVENNVDSKSESTRVNSDFEGSATPNVFEEFTGNGIDLESVVELSDEVQHCKWLSVTVVVNEFPRGTSEEFRSLVQQILTMYTFTSHSFISVHLENIHSVIIHDATPSPPGKSTQNPTSSQSKHNRSNLQTPTAQNTSSHSSQNSKNRRSKQKTSTKETFDENEPQNIAPKIHHPGSNPNASPCALSDPTQTDVSNQPSCTQSFISISDSLTNTTLAQTTTNTVELTSKVKNDSNNEESDTESSVIVFTSVPKQTNDPKNETSPKIGSISSNDPKNKPSQRSRSISSNGPNNEPSQWSESISSNNPKNKPFQRSRSVSSNEPSQSSSQSTPRLLYVSPKSKLIIETIHSVDYYKQLIHFHTGCDRVEEYTRCSNAWRRMRQLMESRRRGVEMNSDGKQLNSADKILLSGPSGSGKSFLVRSLTRALALPLVTVTSSEFSSPSPGIAESSLRAKFTLARNLADENKGLCVLLFEQIHELLPVTPPSLSHLVRLSLSLSSLLDATPPSSPLLLLFTSTSAHAIGARLKTHARVYLTAPSSDMRRAILRYELAPISILNASAARDGSMTGDQKNSIPDELSIPNDSSRERSIRSTPKEATSDGRTVDEGGSVRSNDELSIPNDLSRKRSIRSTPKEATSDRRTVDEMGSERSKFDSIGHGSMSGKTIRERLVQEVLVVTGSFLPVDLMRLTGVVMMYVARNRQFTTEDLISHAHSFLSHYRPSCLKAGGLGVIDLPSRPIDPSLNTRPGVELGMELEESHETDSSGQGGYERDDTSESGAAGRQVGRTTATAWVPELGGLSEVRALIEKKVEWPFKYAAAFERLGIPRSKGILLYGPPGCAKTSLVRSLAVTFPTCRLLAVSAAQLYSPYVGEAEANVALLFHRARSAAPAILFIDEIDALVGNRSEGSKEIQHSVLSVFLNEMDGVGVKPEIGSAAGVAGGVMVIAATNRPTCLDSALVRPGRLDTLIYVRPPDIAARREILGLISSRGRMSCDVDFDLLAGRTELYSGADLASLYTEAALISLLDRGFDNEEITQAHWLQALSVTRPSLTVEQLAYYEQFERSM